ncbi:MAG: LysR family transcriptional regulator [Oscillospiraceae bacterium]
MTIRHLKVFITVVECGTMRQAANKLFVSQPSISQAVQELENFYEVKLFERLSQRLYLTDKGKLFLSYAKHAVDSFENIDLLMKNAGDYSKIRIGASVTIGTFVLNDYICALEEKVKKLDIDVVINNTTIIEDMVRNCKLDIAIVEGMVIGDDLIKTPLFEDELVVVVGKNHPLFNEKMIDIQQLNNQSFISREVGSVDRNQLENLLTEKHIEVKRHWICSNIDTIKSAVSSGRGLAIISKLAIKKEISEGTLKILPIKNMKMLRQIQLIYHKDKFLSQGMCQFIHICVPVTDSKSEHI